MMTANSFKLKIHRVLSLDGFIAKRNNSADKTADVIWITEYTRQICYIDGNKYFANEHRFGRIVVELVKLLLVFG